MAKKKKSKKAEQSGALELLKEQHREVEELFEEFEDASEEDAGKARELAAQICEQLTLHAMIEEEIFYPAVQSEDTAEQLEEAEVEHLSAKRLIADVATVTSDTRLKALMSVLKEQVEHHVEEEEETLFPQVQEEMPEDELEPMGQRLEERYEELKSRGVGKVELPAAEEAGDEEENEEESDAAEDADDDGEDADDVDTDEDDEDDLAEGDEEDDEEDDVAGDDDDVDDDELDDDDEEPKIEPHAEMPTITKKPAATKRKR